MITKQIAVAARSRQKFMHVSRKNADGKSPMRARVNGKCKTWVTCPNDWQLPMKYGLYECFYIGTVSGCVDPADWQTAEQAALTLNTQTT